MKIRFWGVRGSIASPGPDTAAVGGNTSCIEVTCGKTRIALDAGTGLRGLGNELIMKQEDPSLTLLLSHYHWDHIQGLPFFVPIYMKSTNLTIVGGSNGIMSVREALQHQMSAPVFPLRLDEVGAKIATREVGMGESFDVGEARVRVARGNHPGGVIAYRIEHEGKSIVYATDTEHFS
jgi:phosphoribosyl 1,2-cyclic phosphodiesterase